MLELPGGIRRVTFRFPFGVGHVHCYFLPGRDGWTLVDTGLAFPDAESRWAALAAELGGPLERVVITHFHPDHVGGGADVAEATGARVFQGAHDYDQCERVWGRPDWSERLADYMVANGMPQREAAELRHEADTFAPYIRFARDPAPLSAGDEIDGWEIVELPGHADGHICLLRDGVLLAGDHLLPEITPTVGLYPDGRPDPLGDYLVSLGRTIELAPTLALPGHGEPITDPVRRARELLDHHRNRLDQTRSALDARPQTAYELSLALFGQRLRPSERRFAVAETLAHVERLVCTGRAARTGDDIPFTYTAT
jgi:glyoxylase-like metal-dependent hydrolase (beta-lactamase superfamily II)